MEIRTVFQTPDGMIWPTHEEAEKHMGTNDSITERALQKCLDDSLVPDNPKSYFTSYHVDVEELAEIFAVSPEAYALLQKKVAEKKV